MNTKHTDTGPLENALLGISKIENDQWCGKSTDPHQDEIDRLNKVARKKANALFKSGVTEKELNSVLVKVGWPGTWRNLGTKECVIA